MAVLRTLAVIISLLALAHVAAMLTKYVAGYPAAYGLVPLFDLNSERSISTVAATAQLLLVSALVAVIARLKQREAAPFARQWAVLAVALLGMALDEAAGLHELLDRPARDLLGDRATGLLHFAWVVPGLVLVGLVALGLLRFYLHLPGRMQRLVATAALLFLGGAIGVELLEGRYLSLYGTEGLGFGWLVLVEETMELAGVALVLAAMLQYLAQAYGAVRLVLAPAPPAPVAAPVATSSRRRAA